MMHKPGSRWIVGTGILLAVIAVLVVGYKYKKRITNSTSMVIADETESSGDPETENVPVKVIYPKKGVLERLSTQPGSIEMFASVNLFGKVAGFLKTQNVDIGNKVSQGRLLAVVDVPELETQKQRNAAAVEQALARVEQMKARVDSAKADLEAAKAAVEQAAATAKSAAAWVRYRGKYLKRMEELLASRSIEERVVDESKERFEASMETELSAQAAITTTRAKVVASKAKISQATADVAEAEADVKVTRAELEKSIVLIKYATITAPFDGVITHRNFYPGDFIRAAGEGGNNQPLLTIDRTDLMRVVVQIPDRDVPFIQLNDTAEVELDSFPGEKLLGKVSLIAHTLDPQTRLMRVEIHLPNSSGKVYQNVYGQVTIVLDKQKDLLSIPSTCIVGQGDNSKGSAPRGNLRWDIPSAQANKTISSNAAVYVVRAGLAHRVPIRLGTSDGLRVAVLDGLTTEDQVIYQPTSQLAEGVAVIPTVWDEIPSKASVEH